MMRRSCFTVVAVASVALSMARPALGQVLAELRGRVTDARSALPIADARIELDGSTESRRSGADGSFAFRGLEPRVYTLHVRAVGYRARDIDVEVSNGRVTTADVALEPTAESLAPVIITAARDTESGNATTFDRAAIEASGKRDLGELLETTPGLVVTQAGGPGSASHVSIRGSSATEVLVLLDGAAINSPITGDADLSRVSLEEVERVVVRTGAQSARYGGRALAGVIDIQTRHPTADASLLARAGSWGEQDLSASVGDASPLGLGALRAGGSLIADYRTLRGDFPYEIPAVRGGGTAQRLNSGVTSRQLLVTATLDGDALTAALRASTQALDRGLAGSIVQPSMTGREGETRQDAGFDASWRRARFAWTSAGSLTHDMSTYRDPSPPLGTPYDDTVSATGMNASSTIAFGTAPLSATAGAEVRAMRVTSTTLAPGAPRWQRLSGAFGGLRASRQVDSAGTRVGIDADARVDESSLTQGATVSPALVATLSRGALNASVSAGSGFSPPSLADQFFHEGVLVRPNPSLRPERTRNDLEARLAAHDVDAGPLRLSAEAAAFRADIDDMILWLPDFRFIWSPSNYAVRRAGWAASGQASLPAARVDVQGTLNRADVVYAGPVLTGQVAYRPRTTGSVTLAGGPSAIRVELTSQYVGSRRTVAGSPLNALDPYWLSTLRVTSTRAWRTWRFDASTAIENLLNRPAAMLVDYPFPSRSWTVSLRVRRADAGQPPH